MALDTGRLRRQRLARLKSVLAEADVAGALFLDPINIRYATDVSNMQVWCLHNPARYTFVATDGPVIQFEFASCSHLAEGIEAIDDVRPAVSWIHLMAGAHAEDRAADWAAEIADLVERYGGGNRRLAVDRLDVLGFLALQRHGIDWCDGQALVERARMIKSSQELIAMAEAIAACEAAVGAMRSALRPGISEQELWSVLHQHSIAHGGEWIETRLLTSGPRTNPWYQECSERIIEAGDLVAFDTDLIGRYGYCCDVAGPS